jgi:hypothetical protein
VFSARDGSLLKSHSLESPPVFDGLSAARGRLFLTTRDARLICLGQGPSEGAAHVAASWR